MKKLIVLFAIVSLIIVGCNDKGQNQSAGDSIGSDKPNLEIQVQANKDLESSMQSLYDNKLAGQKVVDFRTMKMGGSVVDNSFFEDYNVTLLNIWATNCPPCIHELPELQKIHNDFKDKGIGVLGLVADVWVHDDKVLVERIAEVLSLDFTIMYSERDLVDGLIRNFFFVPVTLLVDSEGYILEQFIPGATDYEGFKELILPYVNE